MQLRKLCRKIPLLSRALVNLEAQSALKWDIYSMHHLLGFIVPWMPWTSSSIRPSSMRVILNEICIHQRRDYIEFGAGISTLYLAEAARRWGGSLTTVEQNAEWLDLINEQLRIAGTIDYVRLLHVPVVGSSGDDKNQRIEWFDSEILKSSVGSAVFDLALVDAPISRNGHRNVRAPAGPWLPEHLAEDFCVFLDDIHRPGEQAIANQWQRINNWTFKSHWPVSSLGIFRTSNSSVYNIV